MRGQVRRGDQDGGRLRRGGDEGARDRDGEGRDSKAGGHALCAAAVDLADRDVHGAALAAGVGDMEEAIVGHERGLVGVVASC